MSTWLLFLDQWLPDFSVARKSLTGLLTVSWSHPQRTHLLYRAGPRPSLLFSTGPQVLLVPMLLGFHHTRHFSSPCYFNTAERQTGVGERFCDPRESSMNTTSASYELLQSAPTRLWKCISHSAQNQTSRVLQLLCLFACFFELMENPGHDAYFISLQQGKAFGTGGALHTV